MRKVGLFPHWYPAWVSAGNLAMAYFIVLTDYLGMNWFSYCLTSHR